MDLSLQLKKLINILATNSSHTKEDICLQLQCLESTLIDYMKNLTELGLQITYQRDKYTLVSQLCLLNIETLQEKLPFSPLYYFYSVDSTNKFLQQNPFKKGSLCIAEHQSAGKGRRNNQWISPFGQNLYYSLSWEVEKKQVEESISILPILISLATIKTLKELNVNELSLKWPNDIYLRGKKLGGVLVDVISNSQMMLRCIIGIGINLTMQRSLTQQVISQAWISLQAALPQIDKNTIVIKLSYHIKQVLVDFEQNNLNSLITEYNSWDLFYNKPVQLFNKDIKLEGIHKGINHQGKILIEKDKKIFTFSAGNITLRGVHQ